MISYREGNEEFAGNRIIGLLKSGVDVALCSDGGYPAISDPGFRLVRSAVAEGLELTVIPGASAVNISLIMSGLPTSSWTFKGFPPRKPGALHRFFADENGIVTFTNTPTQLKVEKQWLDGAAEKPMKFRLWRRVGEAPAPEQPEQPEQPTEPTTPGFGALAALAGLGAVAVLLLRRE